MSDDRASHESRGAAGWRRWEPGLAQLSWPLALRMAAVAEVGSGQRVLDVGCGIGDPTLQVAVLAGPHGRVVGIDLAEPMLAIARERAAALGLTHVEFVSGDVATMALPHRRRDLSEQFGMLLLQPSFEQRAELSAQRLDGQEELWA